MNRAVIAVEEQHHTAMIPEDDNAAKNWAVPLACLRVWTLRDLCVADGACNAVLRYLYK